MILRFRKVKGSDRPFEVRGESRLIRSLLINKLRLGQFFSSYFKGPSYQDHRRLMVFADLGMNAPISKIKKLVESPVYLYVSNKSLDTCTF
jgi:hypothetical protein